MFYSTIIWASPQLLIPLGIILSLDAACNEMIAHATPRNLACYCTFYKNSVMFQRSKSWGDQDIACRHRQTQLWTRVLQFADSDKLNCRLQKRFPGVGVAQSVDRPDQLSIAWSVFAYLIQKRIQFSNLNWTPNCFVFLLFDYICFVGCIINQVVSDHGLSTRMNIVEGEISAIKSSPNEYQMKVEISFFSEDLDIESFLDWIYEMKKFFDMAYVLIEKQVKF